MFSGGRLWDYIRSYTSPNMPSVNRHNSLASLFSEPCEAVQPSALTEIDAPSDEAFLDVLKKYRNSNMNVPASIADTLGSDVPPDSPRIDDMDVTDLVASSQKLLRSVSTTLQKINSIDEDEDVATSRTPITEILCHQNVRRDKTHSDVAVLPAVNRKQQLKRNGSEPGRLSKTLANIPECSIKRWATEIAIAVHRLHEQNISCRDLHPDNLLLGAKGEIQFSYFTRSVDRCLSGVALDGLFVAPERPLTQQSDWWSFGAILFELLTGETFVSCHPAGNASYYEVQYPVNDMDGGCNTGQQCRLIGDDAKDLLDGLLQADPIERAGWQTVRNHRYLADVQWEE